MNHDQVVFDSLLACFSSLPSDEQVILELLSVHYEPMAPAAALELVNLSSRQTRLCKPLALAGWRKLFRRLKSAGLLEGSQNKFRCSPLIVEAITRNAEREGRLDSHLGTLYVSRPNLDPENRQYGIHYNHEAIYRKLRLAVHSNDVEGFSALREDWIRRLWYYPSRFRWEERLFHEPLDKEWLLSRDPSIRNEAIDALVREAHRQLEPVDQLADVLADVAGQLAAPHHLRNLAAQHSLLCGNLPAAQTWTRGDASMDGRLFRGWLCSLQGQHEEAIEHFEASISMTRKGARRRNVVLEDWAGALYVFALISSGERGRLSAAQKYVDVALKEPGPTVLYEALRCAILLAEGKVEIAKSKSKDIDSKRRAEQPPLNALFIAVVLCWCGAANRGVHRQAAALETRAAQAGYRWLALEFGRVRNRAAPDSRTLFPADESGDDLGTVPLLDSLVTASAWERGLSALERLTATSFVDKSKRSSESRLVWRVTAAAKGHSIQAFEQTQTKTGKWSKGRAVGLNRLHARTKVGFLTQQDFAVCEAIEKVQYKRYAPEFYFDYGAAFRALVGHPLVYRLDDPSARLEIVQSEPHLEVTTGDGVVRMKLAPEPPASGDVVVQPQSTTRVVVFVFERKHREVAEVLGSEGLAVPSEMSHRIGPAIHSVSSLVTVHSDLAAGSVGSTEVPADSAPQFLLTPFESGLRVEPVARPLGEEGPSFYPGQGGVSVFAFIDGKAARGQRDLAEEQRRFDSVVSACPSLGKVGSEGSAWIVADPQSSLELLEELHSLGDAIKVGWPEGEKLKIHGSAASDRLALKIRRSKDWFGIDGKLELDSGLVLTLRQVLDLMDRSTGRFLPLKDNEFLALTDRFRRRIEDLSVLVDRNGKRLRLHSSRAHALESIVEAAGSVDSDAAWAQQIQGFRNALALDPEIPSTLQADLRDYQVDGFKWAARLAAWGAGACLADDMGLGKTLQALTVALTRAPAGPALVVAPTSVCPNWIDEARRFAPTLNPLLFGAGNRQKMLQNTGSFDVVVCSYGLLHQEVDSLSAVHWSMIVLDEAQAIKNRETMRSRAAMRLAGDFRMITTGTPIENHLGELHNLFSFINPGLLGTADSFAKQFAVPIHQEGSQAARARLKRLIQPFILRRTKSAVLDELPARTEITLRVEMSREERALYEALRQRAVESLDQKGVDDTRRSGHIEVLAEITRLRRACCHPRLVMPGSDIAGSKLETFLETVEELIENRHKALVFSQFVGHLDIVRAELDRREVDYRYLDGSTPSRKRQQEIDAFQAGKGSLFLISLKAGGQGLNLTAADYVVHLDPWWNPAVEDQASDRAHRIGQTRPVTIYRLVMKDSIEEKIVDLHRSKRDLADNLLAGTDMSGKMSADELLNLLREH